MILLPSPSPPPSPPSSNHVHKKGDSPTSSNSHYSHEKRANEHAQWLGLSIANYLSLRLVLSVFAITGILFLAVIGAVIGAIITIVLAPIAVPAALGLVGFGSLGVVAGSIAAGIQASIGSVAAGSLFAVAQSIGAGGALPAAIYAVVGALGAGVGAGAGAGVGATAAATLEKQDPNDTHLDSKNSTSKDPGTDREDLDVNDDDDGEGYYWELVKRVLHRLW